MGQWLLMDKQLIFLCLRFYNLEVCAADKLVEK